MDMSSPAPSPNAQVTVRRGDTLIGLVKAHYKGQGVTLDERQAFLAALRVASANGIADAGQIQPGQTVRMESPAVLAEGMGAARRGAMASPSTADVLAQRVQSPVFERTLARAVERGFVPPHEQDAVRQRVARLGQDYGFTPDDFARVALIESDGLNPAASNGRCHGIIQFCGGPGRGAASVGYLANPQEIARSSVLQQLDLVDRYFQDVGLPRGGKLALDDLYLAVLSPAARVQRASDVPLPIAGVQARALYEGGQREGVITRRSLTQGLVRHAQERLSENPPALATLSQAGSTWPQQRQ